MAQYVMQARSSSSGAMVTWVTPAPDFAGDAFPGPGSPEYVAATIVGDPFGAAAPAEGSFVTTDAATQTIAVAPSIPENTIALLEVTILFGAVVSGVVASGRYNLQARAERLTGTAAVVSGVPDASPDVDPAINTVFYTLDINTGNIPSLFVNGLVGRTITWNWRARVTYQALQL
jgi:hypothetical protein